MDEPDVAGFDTWRTGYPAGRAWLRQRRAVGCPVQSDSGLGEWLSMGLDEFDAIAEWVESKRPSTTLNGL